MIVYANLHCIQRPVTLIRSLYSRSCHEEGLKVKPGTRTAASLTQRKPEALLVRIVSAKNGFAVGENCWLLN